MLTALLHRLVANPWIYDLAQELAGVRHVHRRLAAQIEGIDPGSLVLDLGGGTGIVRNLLPATCKYICLDLDMLKLHGFARKYPAQAALCSDATRIGMKPNGADIVISTLVTHHVPDGLLEQFISESARVLKNGGKLIFMEPLWPPKRMVGHFLWKYDRGSYPRTPEAIRAAIATRYSIEHWERFVVYHEYVLCVASKQPFATPGGR